MDSGMVGQQTPKFPYGSQNVAARYGNQGDQICSNLHGLYYEQNYNGNLFCMDSDSVTLAAANATKGALATVKLINGFFNPLTSGKNAVIIACNIGTVSGTAAGPFYYNFLQDSTINSASTGTIRSPYLTLSPALASLMTPQTGVVVTNAAGGTTALKQLALMGGPAAIAAGAGNYSNFDFVDGKIIVPPGVLFGVTCTGAGTTHIVQSTLMWEEVPV